MNHTIHSTESSRWAWLRSPLLLFILLCALIPIIAIGAYIDRVGENVPFLDEWSCCLEVAIQTREGTLTVGELFRQHNNHRLVFTKLVDVVATLLTDWNLRAEMFVNLVLAAGIFLFTVLTVRRISGSRAVVAAVLIPLSLMVFSYRQQQSWLQGSQTSVFFQLFFFALGIWLIATRKRGWSALIWAAVCAACATYSYFSGLLAWFVLPVILWLAGYRNWRQYLLWAVLAALTIGLFFTNYSRTEAAGLTQTSGFFSDPLTLIRFTLGYLGNTFVIEHGIQFRLAQLAGLGGLIFAALNAAYLWWRRRDLKLIAPWIAFVLFGVGLGLVTGLGRAYAYGADSAVTTRYVTSGAFAWLGILPLIALGTYTAYYQTSAPERGISGGLLSIVNVIFAVALIPLYVQGNHSQANAQWIVGDHSVACMEAVPLGGDPACLQEIGYTYPQEFILAQLDRMVALRLGVFADGSTPLRGLTLTPIGQQIATQWTFLDTVREGVVPALLQHPPSRVEFAVQLPLSAADIRFVSSLYVNTGPVPENPDAVPDGAAFRVLLRDGAGTEHLLAEGQYIVGQDSEPVPLRANLSPWYGQSITLILETDLRENAAYDNALWVNPQFVITGTR